MIPAKSSEAGTPELSGKCSSQDGWNHPTLCPKTPPPQAQIKRNPAAVAAARRVLNLDFMHECAGGIGVHCGLVQTFAEIGDVPGVCYALKRLFAHVKAAHPVYLELRNEHPTTRDLGAP